MQLFNQSKQKGYKLNNFVIEIYVLRSLTLAFTGHWQESIRPQKFSKLNLPAYWPKTKHGILFMVGTGVKFVVAS